MQLTDNEVDKLKKLVRDRESGYLNEKTLESAIKAIANHESSHVLDWVIVLAIATLLITGLWTMKPKTQVLPSSFPEISTSTVKGLKADAVILQENHHDGKSYVFDFNLSAKGSFVNVSIPSPCDGIVADSKELSGYGNTTSVECPDGYRYFFAHLAEKGLTPMTKVSVGQAIAIQGSTGHSTGEHVHFELSKVGSDRAITERYIVLPILKKYLSGIEHG